MKLWSAWAGVLFLVCACSNSVDSGTTGRLDNTSIKPAVTEPLDTSTTETSVKTADISTTIGTDQTVNDFELTVTAPTLVYSYSQFEVSVASEEEIVDTQIVSDRFGKEILLKIEIEASRRCGYLHLVFRESPSFG